MDSRYGSPARLLRSLVAPRCRLQMSFVRILVFCNACALQRRVQRLVGAANCQGCEAMPEELRPRFAGGDAFFTPIIAFLVFCGAPAGGRRFPTGN